MQDGTVIPVQVDSQGRLVAEGLEGPAGPQGPQGPEGPAAPGGGLPTGANEGDVLMWHQGQAVWGSNSGAITPPKPPQSTDYTSMLRGVPGALQSPGNLFNGNEGVCMQADRGKIIFEPTVTISGRIQTLVQGVFGGVNYVVVAHFYDAAEKQVIVDTSNVGTWIDMGTGSLAWMSVVKDNVEWQPTWCGIKVNGVLLTDGQPPG